MPTAFVVRDRVPSFRNDFLSTRRPAHRLLEDAVPAVAVELRREEIGGRLRLALRFRHLLAVDGDPFELAGGVVDEAELEIEACLGPTRAEKRLRRGTGH